MSFLIKEYKIPFLGKIKYIEATNYDKSFNGKYYAENKILGKFCKKYDSLDELNINVKNRIKEYFEAQKIITQEVVDKNKQRLKSLESTLDDFDEANWLEGKQTNNPLQVELQKSITKIVAEIESQNNK